MRRALAALLSLAALVAPAALAGCEPDKPPKNPHEPKCPPPPEPDHQAVVVGTIGKLHMVESRYPLSKLADVMAAFKPDLVLLAVRVDPFREGRLEDASFEMTYLSVLAKNRAIAAEPIDWFREDEIAAPAPAVEPADEAEMAKREADALLQPKLYTFEQANGDELEQKTFLATLAEARHRGGNARANRRAAWMEHLATNAVIRHQKPRKVLAYVDVLDRPGIDLALRAVGYEAKNPVTLVSQASEVMVSDVPPEVLASYKEQLGRVHERIEKASGAEKAFWQDKERVLSVVVEKRASCCVSPSAVGGLGSGAPQ